MNMKFCMVAALLASMVSAHPAWAANGAGVVVTVLPTLMVGVFTLLGLGFAIWSRRTARVPVRVRKRR
jgi:hypothetical protein